MTHAQDGLPLSRSIQVGSSDGLSSSTSGQSPSLAILGSQGHDNESRVGSRSRHGADCLAREPFEISVSDLHRLAKRATRSATTCWWR